VRNSFGLIFGWCWVVALGITGAQAQSNMVTVAGNNKSVNLDGQGRDFAVAGNHNNLKIGGECKSVQVQGNQNTVHLERVDEIKITGAQNRIFYRSGSTKSTPSVSQVGVQNRVAKVEERGSAGPGTQAAPDNGQLVLTGDDSNLTRSVKSQGVHVLGDRNRVTLTGSVDELLVTGKNNSIAVEKVSKVRFLGDNNSVIYQKSPNVQKPEVASVGENNSVRPAD